ncbi:MAG: enoyl-CoA hydratase/isomerase family protein [Chloroflexi bacterium]|nr:enoyl-CoA hydratase/isomerase family protein [Chloroflexota bacterium]
MVFETVIYEKVEGIAVIKLNRPKVLNAINVQLTRDFHQALAEAALDTGVKGVVIKGEGRAFCAGDDLSESPFGIAVEDLLRHVETLQDTTRIMLNMEKCIVAAVHGYALGAGCEWAMSADIRIAAEGTRFGFPETNVGAGVTNAGTKLLPLLVGIGRAKWMIFSNERIDAFTAEQWGLVNRVVPAEELDSVAMDLVNRIAANSPLSIKLAKRQLHYGTYQDYEQQMEMEAHDVVLTLTGMEAAIRAKAALDKTKQK